MRQEIKNFNYSKSGMGRYAISIKAVIVIVLGLILLIPSNMIKSIIYERQYQSESAISDVQSSWANEQLVSGPIFSIPVHLKPKSSASAIIKKTLYLLPDELFIYGDILPTKLKRGIYDVVVYDAQLSIQGSVDTSSLVKEYPNYNFSWGEASMTFGCSDLRGIVDEIKVNWNGITLDASPGSKIKQVVESGFTVHTPLVSTSTNDLFQFSLNLGIQGSKSLSFVPVGRTTEVNLSSKWESPSFSGAFLPDDRSIHGDGFNANWKILEINRNFPQSWMSNGASHEISTSSFGVNLIIESDDYQKSMRSIKYAAMTIALTFLIFFLIEIMYKRKIHPFQYGLVGLALCLFYVLLVSISEHVPFNTAYLIATNFIVGMIGIYSISVFKNKKLSLILTITLALLYGFLFGILQLTDYALLLGSMGLVLMLGATMYFTRGIEWYPSEKKEVEETEILSV